MKYFNQPQNLHRVNDVRHAGMNAAESLVPETSFLKLKLLLNEKYKSLGIVQVPVELTQAGCKTFCSKNHILINSIWNEEELPQQWKESVTVHIYTIDTY
jgi:hypothetical protein